MPRGPSVAFISGSKAADGIFQGNFQVYRGAQELSLPARWIQCIDPGDSEGHYRGGVSVQGWRLPFRSLELGLNRLFKFPSEVKAAPEDRLFLGDPTFLRLANASTSTRIIVHVHDLRPLTRYGDRWATRWMFRYAIPRLKHVHRIMVHTEYVRRQLETLPGITPEIYVLSPHVEVLPDMARAHADLSQTRQSREGTVRVMYVATDRPYKNIRFFFELARALSDEREPRFSFVLISRLSRGSERELDRIRPTNLTVVPFASHLGPLYMESDILAFPSLYEGFGLPVLDALSYGMPVVANDLDPMREILDSAGTLAPAGDMAAWKEALRALAEPTAYREAAARSVGRAATYSRERFLGRIPGLLA